MILDKLEASALYEGLHPLFPQTFAYLKTLTPASIPDSKHIIDGEKLFVAPFKGQGSPLSQAKLEAHRRYIDIHLLLDGNETFGWKPACDCVQPKGPFNEENDIIFYADAPETWLSLTPGRFVIVWPDEAHAVRVSDAELTKVVVKVLV